MRSKKSKILTEARVSPYAKAHPSFGGITKKFTQGGLSSAPFDTIKFIMEALYMTGVVGDAELDQVKRSTGFKNKKAALLAVIEANEAGIQEKSDEIAQYVEDKIDIYIQTVGTDRGREGKYNLQAEERAEMAKQEFDREDDITDGLEDLLDNEKLIVVAAVTKVLQDINANLGDEGLDIDERALQEVADYSDNIQNLDQLKSFINQISSEPGYEKIAVFLSSAVKPIQDGLSEEGEEKPWRSKRYKKHGTRNFRKAPAYIENEEEVVTESSETQYVSFKEKFKPRNVNQLIELRGYGY